VALGTAAVGCAYVGLAALTERLTFAASRGPADAVPRDVSHGRRGPTFCSGLSRPVMQAT